MTSAKEYRVALNSFVKEFNGRPLSEIEALLENYPILIINCTISTAASSSSSSRLNGPSRRLRDKLVSIGDAKQEREKYRTIMHFWELDEEISVY